VVSVSNAYAVNDSADDFNDPEESLLTLSDPMLSEPRQ
jgi:hypothetical protein